MAIEDLSRPVPAEERSQRKVMLAMMTAAYTLNFVDRTIIASIGQAIKIDLQLTDTQLGLLGGLYFALLYTLLGLPLARLAALASALEKRGSRPLPIR